jgi:hypothetical protein
MTLRIPSKVHTTRVRAYCSSGVLCSISPPSTSSSSHIPHFIPAPASPTSSPTHAPRWVPPTIVARRSICSHWQGPNRQPRLRTVPSCTSHLAPPPRPIPRARRELALEKGLQMPRLGLRRRSRGPSSLRRVAPSGSEQRGNPRGRSTRRSTTLNWVAPWKWLFGRPLPLSSSM